MKVKYKLKEVRPKIFLVTFKQQYDLCMTFVRWQEYYESGSKKIRNKKVDFFQMMKEYSLRMGKNKFTYTRDWYGFNLPSWVFDQIDPVYGSDTFGWEGLSHTPYDNIMADIVRSVREQVEEKYNSKDFYLIGVAKKYYEKWDEVKSIIKHEMSHGFFYLNPVYEAEMRALVDKIPKKKLKKFHKALKTLGYCKEVYVDEIVAYMATGLTEEMSFMESSKSLRKKFRKVYKSYADASKHSSGKPNTVS